MLRYLLLLAVLALVDSRTGVALAQQTVMLKSDNHPTTYIRHSKFKAVLSPVGSDLDKKDATFKMWPALNREPGAVSFESVNFPGQYLRHFNFRLELWVNDGSQQFAADASFRVWNGLSNGGAKSFEAWNFGQYFIRHKFSEVWVGANENSKVFAADATFHIVPVDNPMGDGGGKEPDPDPKPDDTEGGNCTITADVDVYPNAGGDEEKRPFIAAGSVVTSNQQQDGWYRITGPNVPGGQGWVWGEHISCN